MQGPKQNHHPGIRPPGIRTDESNPFAHYTMSDRLPSVIDEVIEMNPDYPPSIADALRRLKNEVVGDLPLRSIAPPAPDWGSWEEQYLRHRGETWLHTEWFFAEQLFYRRIIEAVRWWETGRDPFAPIKEREYASSAHRELFAEAARRLEAAAPDADRLAELLLLDLWGNRIDLSYKASAALGAEGSDSGDLIADDREPIIAALLNDRTEASLPAVHIVTDNAGSELTMDLLLADLLVGLGFTLFFHVKMHPTYVSDTTAVDILRFIRRLGRGEEGETGKRIGRRLDSAFHLGRIRIVPDLFWNSGRFLAELPPRLLEPIRGAALLILKGDVNYRRMSRDALWLPWAGFTEVVGSFPVPLALLRTMKSDTVFGLDRQLVERLDAQDPEWKSNGRRGLIQYFA